MGWPDERQEKLLGEYTSTYDASHKVARGGSHLRGFIRHIARDVDEKAGFQFKHANPNIDPERIARNVTMVNDGAGGFRRPVSVEGRPPSEELEDYLAARLATVKKSLRKDAVVMRPLVLQLDPRWFRDNDPDWRENGISDEAQGYTDEQLRWACDEFGQENIVGYSLHLDEAQPQLQVMFTPVTEDGRLSQKDFFKGPGDFRRQRAELNGRLEAAGYDVDHRVSERSKEHLSSAEFQARADRLRAQAQELENEAAAYDTLNQSLANRSADLNERAAHVGTRESELADREKKLNTTGRGVALWEQEVTAKEQEAAQKIADAAQMSEAAQKALEAGRKAQAAAERLQEEALEEREAARKERNEAETARRGYQAAQGKLEALVAIVNGVISKMKADPRLKALVASLTTGIDGVQEKATRATSVIPRHSCLRQEEDTREADGPSIV